MAWGLLRKVAKTTSMDPDMNSLLLPQSQVSALLGRLPLFKDLPDDTLKSLAAGTQQVHVSRNEAVYAKGDRADFLHVVVGGQVKLFLTLANGAEKMVGMATNGEAFDVAALLLGEPHPAHAMARQDSHLLLMDRYVLLKELKRDSALAFRLLNETARQKLSLMLDLESCTAHSSLQRVACYLLQHRPERLPAYDVHLPTTKREVAEKLNLSQETLSRVLHQLIDTGVLSMHGRLISVLDGDRLMRIGQDNHPVSH